MAQQKVFVASDVGGHKELVKNEDTGILFKADDVEEFVKAVDKLISSKELQNKVRKNGLDFVKNERNWKNSVEKYKKVYEKSFAFL